MYTELTTAVALGKAAYDSSKGLLALARSVDKIDLQLQNAELRGKLVELVNQMGELNLELVELRRKIEEREKTEYVDGVYWQVDRIGQGDPYCAKCFEGEKKRLIHMRDEVVPATGLYGSHHRWICHTCKHFVKRTDMPTTPAYLDGPVAG